MIFLISKNKFRIRLVFNTNKGHHSFVAVNDMLYLDFLFAINSNMYFLEF